MPAKISYKNSKAFIGYALDATRSRIRFVQIASTLAATFTLAVVIVTVLVAGDHFISGGLPGWLLITMRWLLAVGLGAMAAASVVYPLIRRRSNLHTARIIEGANPQLHDSLTASVQLADDKQLPTGVLQAVRRFAASQAGDIDFASVISTTRLRNCGMAFVAAVLVLTVYWMATPKAVWPSLRRIFGNDAIAAPTLTQISIIKPQPYETVLAGTPVKFLVDISRGNGPTRLELARDGENYRPGDSIKMVWIAATDSGNDRYVAYWPQASAENNAVRFRILCGDAVSQQQDLIVLAEPLVRDLTATLHWPT